jgi:hypothetical protein
MISLLCALFFSACHALQWLRNLVGDGHIRDHIRLVGMRSLPQQEDNRHLFFNDCPQGVHFDVALLRHVKAVAPRPCQGPPRTHHFIYHPAFCHGLLQIFTLKLIPNKCSENKFTSNNTLLYFFNCSPCFPLVAFIFKLSISFGIMN